MSLPHASLPPARFSAQNRSRALQAEIMELILERDLKAGDALPTEAELAAILADDATPVFVGVDDSDRPLGHGFCVMQHSGGQLMEEHDTLYIDDICVDEAARGLGVGRALYDHILAYARQKGCYNVTLNVWTCNPGAMRFYEKLGLKPYKIGMEMIL